MQIVDGKRRVERLVLDREGLDPCFEKDKAPFGYRAGVARARATMHQRGRVHARYVTPDDNPGQVLESETWAKANFQHRVRGTKPQFLDGPSCHGATMPFHQFGASFAFVSFRSDKHAVRIGDDRSPGLLIDPLELG